MASFLIVYGTGEGQTAKVANQIAETIEGRGHSVTTHDIERLPDSISLGEFEAVLVGSSVHVSQHHEEIQSFVKTRRESLAARPTAFFQLSLSSATNDPARRAEAANYVDSFLEETDWQPDKIGLFGGALRYSKYGFLKRLLMKRIARDATGDVDTSTDHEYTDWDEVTAFADDFAGFVEARIGTEQSE